MTSRSLFKMTSQAFMKCLIDSVSVSWPKMHQTDLTFPVPALGLTVLPGGGREGALVLLSEEWHLDIF